MKKRAIYKRIFALGIIAVFATQLSSVALAAPEQAAGMLNSATLITEHETPTGLTISEGDSAAFSSSYYSMIKGSYVFTPEQDKGAHFYAFSSMSTTYTEAFANIVLPTGFNNANNTRNAYLCLGIQGTLGGIDLGLQNVGTGWRPYYYDVAGKIGASYSAYTAPSSTTNAVIVVKPVNTTTVHMYIKYLDASGNQVGMFDQDLPISSGNLTYSNGSIQCRYFRFASFVPNANASGDNRTDGSYMTGGKFTNCQLYNGSSYVSWGIKTARVVSAWEVYPDLIDLTYPTDYNDVFDIRHS